MNARSLKASILGIMAVALLAAGSPLAVGAPERTAATERSATTGVVIVSTTLAYGGQTAGTGVVLTSSGEVLTNNHVIRGASSVRVTDTSTGRTYTASVSGYSVAKDIALLELRNAYGLKTALLGTSSNLDIGDRIVAVGNAGGTGVLTTKTGRLLRVGRSITVTDDDGSSTRLTGLIETSAPLRPGDSGGPLLSNGRVIGIDAAATSSFRFRDAAGRGYAIPIDAALAIARRIRSGLTSATVHVGPTAFLGVALAPNGSAQDVSGAWVRGVSPGSPAATAGLGPDDVITSFAGRRVTSAASLRNLVLRFAPGRVVRVTWLDRFTGSESARVRLVSGPPQ
jgi:S1-C subfamily serine protease